MKVQSKRRLFAAGFLSVLVILLLVCRRDGAPAPGSAPLLLHAQPAPLSAARTVAPTPPAPQ
ncbi:MAG: hypothetical protein ACRETS_05810, partial [Steroidobacteraceae bacterium]